MRLLPFFAFPALLAACGLVRSAFADDPVLPGIGEAMQEMVAKNEIVGAVTMVVTKDRILHLESTGLSDADGRKPMTPEALFWIASMTKPVTGTAVLMLQDEGKLKVGDAVAKYLPEFAGLKTPSGRPANLTIAQLLTHTSGLGEAGGLLEERLPASRRNQSPVSVGRRHPRARPPPAAATHLGGAQKTVLIGSRSPDGRILARTQAPRGPRSSLTLVPQVSDSRAAKTRGATLLQMFDQLPSAIPIKTASTAFDPAEWSGKRAVGATDTLSPVLLYEHLFRRARRTDDRPL